jgi:hypothetical protein
MDNVVEQYEEVDNSYSGASKVERAVSFAQANAKYGTDQQGRSFALLSEGDENPYAYQLEGGEFKEWLMYSMYKNGRDFLKSEEMKEVLGILSAYAKFEGESLNVHFRSAKNADGSVELDCADEEGTRIRLKDGEVSVITAGSDVLFQQATTIQALTIPADEGDWRLLLPFLNMSEETALLLIAWITYTIAHPKDKNVGYVLLCVTGNHGTGKSLLCKSIIRKMIDPNESGIQVFPKDMKDVMISSQNMFVLVYDNLAHLSKDVSNKLCVFATGGTFSTRKLYTDADEYIMQVHSPIVLNSIEYFVTAPDLASRCLNIELLTLDPNKREDEKILKARLENQFPEIYRGILELTAKALSVLDSVNVMYPERMLGFVRWLAALEVVMDLEKGTLQQLYSHNLKQAMLDTIQENPLAYTVLEMAKEYQENPWEGSPNQLLVQLNSRSSRHIRFSNLQWPQNPIALSKRLATLQNTLKVQGVILKLGERKKHRQITLGYAETEKA